MSESKVAARPAAGRGSENISTFGAVSFGHPGDIENGRWTTATRLAVLICDWCRCNRRTNELRGWYALQTAPCRHLIFVRRGVFVFRSWLHHWDSFKPRKRSLGAATCLVVHHCRSQHRVTIAPASATKVEAAHDPQILGCSMDAERSSLGLLAILAAGSNQRVYWTSYNNCRISPVRSILNMLRNLQK